MENSKGYKLEYREGTKWNEKGKSWYLECRGCGEMTRIGNENVESVLCHNCVSKSLSELENDNNQIGNSVERYN